MEVISLDEERVTLKKDIVLKKSTKDELNTLIQAYHESKRLSNIIVPKVYEYKNGTICMERLYGSNLELMLRNQTTHDYGVKKLNYLLDYLMNSNFYWKDFAPRNILINDEKYMIFDFERGLDTKKINKQCFLINNVYEEYSAFLLPKERIYHENDVFNVTSNKKIEVSRIKSERIKKILSFLGYSNEVPISIYALAVKMIVVNEEPYIKDKEIIYPLIELEEFIKSKGKEEYARKIIGGYYAKNRKI